MKKHIIRNKRLTTIIAIPSLFLAIFLAPTMGSAAPEETPSKYFNNITDGLSKGINSKSKEFILQTFCETMINENVVNGYVDQANNSIYYTPKFSLFVQSLCGGIKIKGSTSKYYSTFYKPSIITGTAWDKILGKPIKGCEGDFSKCDLSELLPALFNSAMNDHSTLSVAGRAMKDGEKGLTETINKFSITYFGSFEKICGEKGSELISSKGAASDKNGLCSHPSTYQSLKDTITMLQKQKNNLRIVEGNDFGGGGQGKIKCDEKSKYDSLFECGYTNQTEQDAGRYQYNLWYNELLYYKILISWLTNDKLLDPNIKPLNLTQDIKIDLSDEIQNLKREEILSENAIQIMQKTINNIRATFPLHVGLQIYYEDAVAFRKSLVKIYTPIHQLNYKLRNIQEKK